MPNKSLTASSAEASSRQSRAELLLDWLTWVFITVLPRAFLGCFVFAAIGMIVLVSLPARVGFNVSADMANQQLHHRFNVPSSATQVCYSSLIYLTKVSCKLSEEDFLNWCRSEGWQAVRVNVDEESSQSTSMEVFQADGEMKYALVEDGYDFDSRDGDLGFAGAYDKRTGLAYVVYSSR